MSQATSTNDKNHLSSDSSKNPKRNAPPQDNFNQVYYNQMIDDSKHTDMIDVDQDGDLSRYEYSDTQIQDSDRNLHQKVKKSSSTVGRAVDDGALTIDDLNVNKTTDMISHGASPADNDYNYSKQPLKQRDSSGKKYQLAKGFSHDQYEGDEEQKTHDLIKRDLYDPDYGDNTQNISKNYQHFNTEGYVDEYEDLDSMQKQNTQPKASKFSGMYQLKPQLPQMKVNIPLAISGNDIFEIFTAICKNQRFQVIEMDQNIATAVNKEPFSLKKIFQRCIPFASDTTKKGQDSESQISAVRLQISVNEVKICRKVALKGLYGDQAKLQEFLGIFKNKLHEAVQQLPQSQRDQGSQNNSANPSNRQLINHRKNTDSRTQMTSSNRVNTAGGRRVSSDDDSDSEQSSAYNETSSIYQIHKILSSDQYTLGKNVAQYIDCFHLQYKSLRESSQLLPQPMEGIMGLIQETVQSFNSEYNLGKQHAKPLMTHCRPSVEKYVFSKLYDKLFAMYAIKNEEEDRLFQERSGLIKRIKAHDIMRYLGIRDQFILGENTAHTMKFEDHIKDLTGAHGNISHYDSHRSDMNLQVNNGLNNVNGNNQHHTATNSLNHEQLFNQTSSSSIGALSALSPGRIVGYGGNQNNLSKNDLPFIDAIKCLEKMQQYQSPREKLQCISESFGKLKTQIVDHWKGKLELNTMDDVLPLTIYVVAMSDLSHPLSEFNIMEDYLQQYDKGLEFEKKLLTNFDVSIRYVNHEWEIPANIN